MWEKRDTLLCWGETGDLLQWRKEVLTQRGESSPRPRGEMWCSPGVEDRSALAVGGELISCGGEMRYSAGEGKSNTLSGGEMLGSPGSGKEVLSLKGEEIKPSGSER